MDDPHGEADVDVLAVVGRRCAVHHADDAVVTTDVDLALVDRRGGRPELGGERVEEPAAAVGTKPADVLLVDQVRADGRRCVRRDEDVDARVGRVANRADGVEPEVRAVDFRVLHQHVLRDVERRVGLHQVHAFGGVNHRTARRLHGQNRRRAARPRRSENRDHFARSRAGIAENHEAGPLAAHKQLLIGDRHDRDDRLGKVDGEGRAEDPSPGVPVVGVVDRARVQAIGVVLRAGDDRARAPEGKHLRVRRTR